MFWHTVKPLLRDKNKFRENTILVNDEQITSDAVKVAITLYNFSQTSLKISKFLNTVEDKLPHSLSMHLTLNAILKYKNHPSIRIIIIFLGVFQVFISYKLIKILFLKKSENEI